MRCIALRWILPVGLFSDCTCIGRLRGSHGWCRLHGHRRPPTPNCRAHQKKSEQEKQDHRTHGRRPRTQRSVLASGSRRSASGIDAAAHGKLRAIPHALCIQQNAVALDFFRNSSRFLCADRGRCLESGNTVACGCLLPCGGGLSRSRKVPHGCQQPSPSSLVEWGQDGGVLVHLSQ